MADIFLSYASEDIAIARAFARLLSARGWDVWWDHKIPPGKTYVEVIEQELETCKCVIVVWSIHSVVSEWVKREAAEGGDRQILVPVRLDDSRLPFEFRRLQAANLRGWQGEPDRPRIAWGVPAPLGDCPIERNSVDSFRARADRRHSRSGDTPQSPADRAQREDTHGHDAGCARLVGRGDVASPSFRADSRCSADCRRGAHVESVQAACGRARQGHA